MPTASPLCGLQRPKRGRVSGLAGCAEAGARRPAPRALATRTACGCGGGGARCLRRRALTHGRSVTRASWALRGRATGIVETVRALRRDVPADPGRRPGRPRIGAQAGSDPAMSEGAEHRPATLTSWLCRARRARGPAPSDSSADRGVDRGRGRGRALPGDLRRNPRRGTEEPSRTGDGPPARTPVPDGPPTPPRASAPSTNAMDGLGGTPAARMPRNRPWSLRRASATDRGLLLHPPELCRRVQRASSAPRMPIAGPRRRPGRARTVRRLLHHPLP